MIKLQAIESFTLGRFDELENIERVGQDTYGRLNTGDKFECTKDLADYLLGDNPVKRAVVKVIEVIPEKNTIYNSTTTYKNDVPITQGLDVVTEYKTTKSTKKKKSSKK